MNHAERLELVQALAIAGVKHFKSGDTEITFDAPSTAYLKAYDKPAPQAPSPDDSEKIQKLVDTFKMKPEDLLDQIFPNGAGG